MFDGVEVVTTLVQRTHEEVSDRWTERVALIEPAAPIARGVNAIQKTSAAITYTTIRVVSRGVGRVVRSVTDPLLDEGSPEEHDGPDAVVPMRQDAQGSLVWWVSQAEGTLNGFFGDHLAARGNALDLTMTLRVDGRAIPLEQDALARALPAAKPKVCVFVHGLSTTEWCWVLFAAELWGDPTTCFGTELERDLGFTPLFVRYNSGRHVSDNGQALSALLAELCAAFPVPIEELAIVGHSMGGLVARSAAHYGAVHATRWVSKLRHVFCIGSPHLGAPLEKGVRLLATFLARIPAAAATVPAAVLDARSAGIRDLRHGYTIEDEWRDENTEAVLHDNRHDVPLVPGVGYYAVATTVTRDPDHPAGVLLGDLLVRAPSGAGLARAPERHVPFHARALIPGMTHVHMANHPAVYEVLRSCLAGAPPRTGAGPSSTAD